MRRKNEPLPMLKLQDDMPCKNQSPYVASDGGCLRCGAVQGEACRAAAQSPQQDAE